MGIEDLDVAKRRCDRCWRWYLKEELKEDPSTAGIYVCNKCVDTLSFDDMKKASGREAVEHHFAT